jgi:Tfp pilus assembly protein PilN
MDEPKMINPEDLRKTPLLQGTSELFDINILPDRYRRRKITPVSILPWLILVFLLGALYPAGINARAAQSEFRETQSELLMTRAELEIMQTNTDALEKIQNEISAEIDRRDQILNSYGGISLKSVSWNETLLRIYQITPPDIVWNYVSQQENEIQLEGTAASYQAVLDLTESLNNVSGIEQAEIISLEQITGEDAALTTTLTEGEEVVSAPDPAAPYTFTILSLTGGEVLP